ncbi:PorV/PorQ family protein [bacterium]|nr:MAG: PorV/PorQ family protein [bacterium]
MKNIFLFLISAVISTLPFSANAQNGGAAGSFLRLGFGARGMSMANAVSSVPEIGTLSFYNPALNAFIIKRDFDLGTSVLSFDRTLHTVSGSFKLPPSGGISFSVMNAGVSNIDGRSLSGYPTGNFNTNDYLIQTSFGVRSNNRFSFGASIKFLISNYHPDLSNSVAFGVDAGILFKATDETFISLVARDILLTHNWNSNELYGGRDQLETNNYFPMTFVLGASRRFINSKLILSGELLARVQTSELYITTIDNDFFPPISQVERKSVSTTYFSAQFGAMYQVHDRIRVQLGYAQRDVEFGGNDSFSGGFSLFLPLDKFSPSVDYSLTTEPNVGTLIHTIGFRFNL